MFYRSRKRRNDLVKKNQKTVEGLFYFSTGCTRIKKKNPTRRSNVCLNFIIVWRGKKITKKI